MKPDKPYSEMTNEELAAALDEWECRVAGASGFASAHFAAKQVKQIVNVGNSRGLVMVNRYPIAMEAPR